MANILVIAFDNPDEAAQVASTIKQLRKAKVVHLDDMRIVVRDAAGEMHFKDESGHLVLVSAAVGGILGAVLFVTFPVLGAAVGAGIAAGTANMAKVALDKRFVQEVSESLQPNTSELFLLGTALDAQALLDALTPYKGTVIRTTISGKDEGQLKQALSERNP